MASFKSLSWASLQTPIKQHILRFISLTNLGFSIHICSVCHQEFHHVCLSCPGSHMKRRLSPLKHTQRKLLEKRYYCLDNKPLCVQSSFISLGPSAQTVFLSLFWHSRWAAPQQSLKHVSTVTVARCWPTVCLMGNSRAWLQSDCTLITVD